MKNFILYFLSIFIFILVITHLKLQERVNLHTVAINYLIDNNKLQDSICLYRDDKLLDLIGLANGFKSKYKTVNYTVYNALEGQTDSSPLKTADQSIIDKQKLNNGELKWIAVSRDLLKIYSYGDTLKITCSDDPSKSGYWIIHDTMNKRFKNKIDFLVPDSIKLGRGKCLITKK